jgi:hypothetical protein
LFLILFTPIAAASPDRSPAPPAATRPAAQTGDKRVEALTALLKAIQRGELALEERRGEADQASGLARAELTERAQQDAHELERMRREFEEVAAGIEIDRFKDRELRDLDWSAELTELVSPIINELKRATTRPRELDRLAREVEDLQRRSELADSAAATIEQTIADTKDAALRARLVESRERWQEERQRLQAGLQIAQQRRERVLGQETSLFDTVEHVTQVFFRSRGRNLLLALLAFAAAWALVRLLHRAMRRYSPTHRDGRGVTARVLDLILIAGGLLAGSICAMVALYVAGDWVLLTVASLFLFGLAWGSRTALPRIWRQAMILLNLGGVREGERIIHNGVPFEVKALGFYTYLRNPVLTNGLLRLPLAAIADAHSRLCDEEEPWFPTRRNDWVLLNDGALAKVINQTPELVTLLELGGARRTVATAEFFQTPPKVLSSGFRLSVTFGIDYRHQAQSTHDIPTRLEHHLRKGLAALGDDQHLASLAVEFQEAGASSLDLACLADFRGEAAPAYERLRRRLQSLAVDACNLHGWVIPFSQVTVHMAAPGAAT